MLRKKGLNFRARDGWHDVLGDPALKLNDEKRKKEEKETKMTRIAKQNQEWLLVLH